MQLLRAGSAGSTDEPRINRIHNVRAARSLGSRRSSSSSLSSVPPPALLLLPLLSFASLAQPSRCFGMERLHPSGVESCVVEAGVNQDAAGAGATGRSPFCCCRSFTCAAQQCVTPHSHVQPAPISPPLFLYYRPRWSISQSS